MGDRLDFFNLYKHGFVRVAVCVPEVKVADPGFNVDKTIELVHKAADKKAVFALFPELGISAYTNEDLFFQDALLYSVQASIQRLLNATSDIGMVVVVGAPLKVMQRLYNCGIVIQRGKILGIAVKTYIPNYREFYEKRQFSSSRELIVDKIDLCGHHGVPMGANLIFDVVGMPNFSFFIELCEDLWAVIPPSSYAALAGATVIGNLSASNITIGKDEYRNSLASRQSASCVAAYLYAAAGPGESTTDLAWDGHATIYENGNLLAASKRFSWGPQVIIGDVDIDRLAQDGIKYLISKEYQLR